VTGSRSRWTIVSRRVRTTVLRFSSWRRFSWRRPVPAVVLTTLGLAVIAAAVAVPLGGLDTAPGRPIARDAPRPRPVRPVTPVEAAVQGGYAALGDSYSSGEGVYDRVADQALNPDGGRCHRSRGAYYTVITRGYRFARGSTFWACSGARTTSALSGQHGGPPQVGRVDVHTSLITISIGGNDAGFAPVLARCVVKLPWSSACRDQEPEVDARLGELRGRLAGVLGRLTRAAPYARVLVLGYPRPFPARPRERVHNLSAEDQRWINTMTGRLDGVIAAAVRDADRGLVAAGKPGTVEYIDGYDAFAGHEIGTRDPYVNGLDVDIDLTAIAARPHSFHPTAGGYRRFAALVDRQIKAGPGRQIRQYRYR
jgi:lysophospholipase L1-like esterase